MERRYFAGEIRLARTLKTLPADLEDLADGGADEADEPEMVRGYAAVYNSESEDLGGFIERIAPGAFTRSLSQVASGELNVRAFWGHDDKQVIGSTRSGTLSLTSDEHGLAFTLDPARLNTMQRDALAAGDMQVSFGFMAKADQWEERSDGLVLRTLNDLDLFEISPVSFPAYPATEAALRSLEAWRSAVEPEAMTVAELLADKEEAWRADFMRRFIENKINRLTK
jgi:hypothetical protein